MTNNTKQDIKELIQNYRDEQYQNIIFRNDFSRFQSPKSIRMTTFIDNQQYTTEYQLLSNNILEMFEEGNDYLDDNYLKSLKTKPLNSDQIEDMKERYRNKEFFNEYNFSKTIANYFERRPNFIPYGYLEYIKTEFSDYDYEDYYSISLKSDTISNDYQHNHGWLLENLIFYEILFSPRNGSRYYYWLENRHNSTHNFLPQFEFDNHQIPVEMILSMFQVINPRINKAESEIEKSGELFATFNYFLDWLLWSVGYPYLNNNLKNEGINPNQYSPFILENSHNILCQLNWEVFYLWRCNFLLKIWEILFEDLNINESEEIKNKLSQFMGNDYDINKHLTLNDIDNSNYLLLFSNYAISICSLNSYDALAEDIKLKISIINSYFYIPWAILPPNKRSLEQETIISMNSYGSLIEIDENSLENVKIPRNTYPALVKDNNTRNLFRKNQLQLISSNEDICQEIENSEELSTLDNGESIENLNEDELSTLDNGESIENLNEGELLTLGNGESIENLNEGEPLTLGNGESIENLNEGEPLTLGNGESIENLNEGEPIENLNEEKSFNLEKNETFNKENQEFNPESLDNEQNSSQEETKDESKSNISLPKLEKGKHPSHLRKKEEKEEEVLEDDF